MLNKDFFKDYMNVFLEQNSKLNLISKNEEKYLWEKHIFDSLAIEKVFEKYSTFQKLLDIGTGGGFPAVPIAIAYPNIEAYALDSIRKKINAIENIKNELNLENLYTICDRVENISQKFDLITSRAVAPLSKIVEYSSKNIDKNGLLVVYKSRKVQEEIEDAKKILKDNKLDVVDVIEYTLPLEELYVRNLVVIKHK